MVTVIQQHPDFAGGTSFCAATGTSAGAQQAPSAALAPASRDKAGELP
jgi:hypothetical protein